MIVVNDEEREFFGRHGYLVVPNVFTPSEVLAPVYADFVSVIAGLEEAAAATGELSATALAESRHLPFGQRLLNLASATGKISVQPFDINVPRRGLSKATPMLLAPSVFRLFTHPRVLDLVEDFVGSEISLNPVQHIRIKFPERVLPVADRDTVSQQVGWHQDNGVVTTDADDTPTLTVWIPLTKAAVENGCLAVVPGSHSEGVIDHCSIEGQLRIPDKLVKKKEAIPLPAEPGSVVLLHRRIVHCAVPNTSSSSVRISYDLRYQPAGLPTGRFTLPEFVVRSERAPGSVVDSAEWRHGWFAARDRLASATAVPKPHRWVGAGDPCA